MSDGYWVTFQALMTMSTLWFLLGVVIAAIVTVEVMDNIRRKDLNANDESWWKYIEAERKRYEDEIQGWKDILDASTDHVADESYAIFEGCCGYHDEQHSGYFIQDEHALVEVGRDEFDIWLAENGLKGVPDIDEDEMFIEWTEGKR